MKSMLMALLSSGLTICCYYSIRVNMVMTDEVQRRDSSWHKPDHITESLMTESSARERRGHRALSMQRWRKSRKHQQKRGYDYQIRQQMELAEKREEIQLKRAEKAEKLKSGTLSVSTTNNKMPVVDVLSVGSLLQTELQDAQRDTFGSHQAVRHFFAATEKHDAQPSCYQNLKLNHVREVANFCRKRKKSKRRYRVLSKISQHFFSWSALRQKKNPMGWLCAQTRPFDGLYHMIQKYQYNSTANLPDYLLVMDDDTWVNMDQFIQFVPHAYPSTQDRAYVIAGCMMVTSPKIMNLTVPFGGYGIVFNRKALEQLLRPLHCPSFLLRSPEQERRELYQRQTSSSSSSLARTTRREEQNLQTLEQMDNFERMACWRISKNLIGERPLYRYGMSLADLMHAYATDQPFEQVEQWNRVGFCMHSDWLWAYMTNYYHLASRPTQPTFTSTPLLHDRLIGYNDSHVHPWTWGMNKTWVMNERREGLRGQCRNGNDLGNSGNNGNGYCDPSAHLCHRITPIHMRMLHTWNEKNFPQHYQ